MKPANLGSSVGVSKNSRFWKLKLFASTFRGNVWAEAKTRGFDERPEARPAGVGTSLAPA